MVAFAVALGAASCGPDPVPSASAAPVEAARFNVTGSGLLCFQWYMGCGAFLAVEAPGWTLQDGWAPSVDDTRFATDPVPNSERIRVTGITHVAQDRIEPGEHLLVVVRTTSPDDEPQGTLHAVVGCTETLVVPDGTRAVHVEVKFDGEPGCSIDVAMDASTAAPTS